MRISILNRKGGVGKTATAFHLGGALADLGGRVLLVDLDPQGSLSQGWLGPDQVDALPAEQTIATLFLSPIRRAFGEIIRHVLQISNAGERERSISLAPANRYLDPFNVPRPWGPSTEFQFEIARFVQAHADRFDHVIFDCAPNLGFPAWCSLLCADVALVPFQPEDFGAQGIAAVAEFCASAGRDGPLREINYLLTMVQGRLAIHQTYEDLLRDRYKGSVLDTTIPRAVEVAESIAARLPLAFERRSGKAREAYERLAGELLFRDQSVAASAKAKRAKAEKQQEKEASHG
jgi:chromosome partitioning protein